MGPGKDHNFSHVHCIAYFHRSINKEAAYLFTAKHLKCLATTADVMITWRYTNQFFGVPVASVSACPSDVTLSLLLLLLMWLIPWLRQVNHWCSMHGAIATVLSHRDDEYCELATWQPRSQRHSVDTHGSVGCTYMERREGRQTMYSWWQGSRESARLMTRANSEVRIPSEYKWKPQLLYSKLNLRQVY